MAKNRGVKSHNIVTPRFAFLIISAEDRTNRILKFTQSRTWMRDFQQIAPVYFVEGNRILGQGKRNVTDLQNIELLSDGKVIPVPQYQLSKFENNSFIFDSVNGWDQILPNTIGALTEIRKIDSFDFIIRTNLSSYWNVREIKNRLEILPKVGVFAGPVREVRGLRYVEGDAIIMSRDVVNLLLENRKLIDNRVIDDLSIAVTLKKLGVLPIDLPRPRVRVNIKRMGLSYELNNLPKLWHHPSLRFPKVLISYANIRCKDPHQIFGFSIRMDALIFVILKVVFSVKDCKKS